MKWSLIILLFSSFAANAQVPDSLHGKRLIEGVLYNKETREVFIGVRVKLTVGDKYGTREYFTTSNDSGQYAVYIDTSYINEIYFFKDGYNFERLFFEKGFKDTTRYFDMYGWTGTSCGPISIVMYDKKLGTIREHSYDDIKRIENSLKNNPTIVIEMRAHTDCRGSSYKNHRLSKKWVNEVVDILVSRGIDRKRLKAKAMGESELLNRCKDGVKCSDEEHAINNRVDFKVIRNDYKSKEDK